MGDALLFIISLMVGLPRLFGTTADLYKTTAHLWVGGLIGAAAMGHRPALALAVALTVLETCAFLASRLEGRRRGA